jgi:hypothetical protein
MNTLHIEKTVGDSLLGIASFGPRYPAVSIGRMAPLLRKSEDPEGLFRAGFLDPGTPSELNLVSVGMIRSRMVSLQAAPFDQRHLAPDRMVKFRPSIGYVPPELLTDPNATGIRALRRGKGESGKVADLRNENSDGDFWVELAKQKRYIAWLQELVGLADFMGANLVAPPVPVVTNELATSPEKQAELNHVAASVWRQVVGLREVGLMYSLHIHPSALEEPDLLRKTLRGFSRTIMSRDNPYWGVHISYVDVSMATPRPDRIMAAKDFGREAARVAKSAGIFAWGSDLGPVGPVFLDQGLSFVSYHTGMTPRRTYTGGSMDEDHADTSYGKTLGLWKYNLMERDTIKKQGWRVEDNGLFLSEVPINLRGNEGYREFRVGFGRPNNIAVAERLNEERAHEVLLKGNAKPGSSHVGRSNDHRIAPWA